MALNGFEWVDKSTDITGGPHLVALKTPDFTCCFFFSVETKQTHPFFEERTLCFFCESEEGSSCKVCANYTHGLDKKHKEHHTICLAKLQAMGSEVTLN